MAGPALRIHHPLSGNEASGPHDGTHGGTDAVDAPIAGIRDLTPAATLATAAAIASSTIGNSTAATATAAIATDTRATRLAITTGTAPLGGFLFPGRGFLSRTAFSAGT